MQTLQKYDLVIIGGGCAGLSLAARLAEFGVQAPRTLIIEQRETYSNDRTWCFWDIEPSDSQHLIKKTWQHFEIRYRNQQLAYNCQTTPYQMLESSSFYQSMLEKIKSNSKISICLGHAIDRNPVRIDYQWHIRFSGHHIVTKLVVDTRPSKNLVNADSLLWQSFLGIELSVKSKKFDASKLILMDLDESYSDGLGFVYVLPISASKALVEYTVFSDKRLQANDLKSHLERAIKAYLGKVKYSAIRTEHGILPMGNTRPLEHLDDSYLYAGLYAGSARPSSGYAFQRIQSWASLCAKSLVKDAKLSKSPKDSRLQSFMDTLFLIVLKNNQSLNAKIFNSLFKNCNTSSVIRFMSDRANLMDCLKIIFSLPPLPFLKALPGYILKNHINSR
jgi:lycopene beta-cyclase